MNICEGKEMLEWANKSYPIENWRSILYIGICDKTFAEFKGDYFLEYISSRNKNFKCTIVEIEKKYVDIIQKQDAFKKYNLSIINDDILKYVKKTKKIYDVVIWWHGPEHVYKNDFYSCFPDIERICKYIFIIGCPLGETKYKDENSNDCHHWGIEEKDLQDIGFKTELKDRKDRGQDPAISALKYYNNL